MVKRRKRLKRKFVKLLWTLILLVVLIIVFFLIIRNSKKYLFFNGISKSIEIIEEKYDNLKENYFPQYLVDNYFTNVDADVMLKIKDKEENIGINGDIYIGENNYFDLNLKRDKRSYNLGLYSDDDKLYYRFNKSNYYYINKKVNFDTKDDLYAQISKIFVASLKGNVRNSDLKKSKSITEIGTQKKKLNKVSFELSEKRKIEFILDLIDRFKNDDYFKKEYLKHNPDMSLEEFDRKLDSLRDIYLANQKKASDDHVLALSFYYDGSTFVKGEIVIYSDTNITLSLTKLKDYLDLSLVRGNSNYYVILDKNKVNIHIDGIGNGIGVMNSDSFSLEFKDLSDKLIGYVNYKISSKDKESYDVDLQLKLDLMTINVDVSAKNSLKLNERVKEVDVSNSKDLSSIISDDSKIFEEIKNILYKFIDFNG